MTDKQIELKQIMREQYELLENCQNDIAVTRTASRVMMAAECEINELIWENEDLKAKNEALRKLIQMLWK